VAEGLAARGWLLPADVRDEVRKALPPAFSSDASGRVLKR
jgi:hypothetical protein